MEGGERIDSCCKNFSVSKTRVSKNWECGVCGVERRKAEVSFKEVILERPVCSLTRFVVSTLLVLDRDDVGRLDSSGPGRDREEGSQRTT